MKICLFGVPVDVVMAKSGVRPLQVLFAEALARTSSRCACAGLDRTTATPDFHYERAMRRWNVTLSTLRAKIQGGQYRTH